MAPITISEKEQMDISSNRSTEAVINRMIDVIEDLEQRVAQLEADNSGKKSWNYISNSEWICSDGIRNNGMDIISCDAWWIGVERGP